MCLQEVGDFLLSLELRSDPTEHFEEQLIYFGWQHVPSGSRRLPAFIGTSKWSCGTLRRTGGDFVFDKNYKLPTLPEVDKYIKENKHLPGIPSATEIVK